MRLRLTTLLLEVAATSAELKVREENSSRPACTSKYQRGRPVSSPMAVASSFLVSERHESCRGNSTRERCRLEGNRT